MCVFLRFAFPFFLGFHLFSDRHTQSQLIQFMFCFECGENWKTFRKRAKKVKNKTKTQWGGDDLYTVCTHFCPDGSFIHNL